MGKNKELLGIPALKDHIPSSHIHKQTQPRNIASKAEETEITPLFFQIPSFQPTFHIFSLDFGYKPKKWEIILFCPD